VRTEKQKTITIQYANITITSSPLDGLRIIDILKVYKSIGFHYKIEAD